jgi:hypothetical protein
VRKGCAVLRWNFFLGADGGATAIDEIYQA